MNHSEIRAPHAAAAIENICVPVGLRRLLDAKEKFFERDDTNLKNKAILRLLGQSGLILPGDALLFHDDIEEPKQIITQIFEADEAAFSGIKRIISSGLSKTPEELVINDVSLLVFPHAALAVDHLRSPRHEEPIRSSYLTSVSLI